MVAGAPRWEVFWLAVGMFGFQVSIGALNDIVDAERDRKVQPAKPIAAGIVSERAALAIVLAGALAGLGVSAGFGLPVLLVGVVGLGCGYAYDLLARRVGLGWLTFAVALPALLVWTWLAAAGTLPPGWPALLPLAALAGPTVHLANGMADADHDRRSGAMSLATRLGPRRARVTLVVLTVVIWTLAPLGLVLLGAASVAAWVRAVGRDGAGCTRRPAVDRPSDSRERRRLDARRRGPGGAGGGVGGERRWRLTFSVGRVCRVPSPLSRSGGAGRC